MSLDWTALDRLSDDQLTALVAATIDVLEDADTEAEEDLGVTSLPPSVVREQLEGELRSAGVAIGDQQATELTEHGPRSRSVAIAVLEQLGDQPALRSEIESAYAERGGMMIVDGGILTGAALLFLVMKLRRVRVGKDGIDVEFNEFKPGMVDAVKGLLG
jgi:hypothetical protein